MRISQISKENLTFEMIDKLLFQGLEDTGEGADCILVLGSAKAAVYRLPAAVEAYRAGRAPKILLCGGVLRDFPTGRCSEAEHMYRAALEQGIPESDIILENASLNTVENLLCAMVKLQRAFWLNKVQKVLLVTTAYHMRRSLAIARYLFPEHITVLPCPAKDTNTRRENWMNTPAGIERAKGETLKIIDYVKSGVIPDFEF